MKNLDLTIIVPVYNGEAYIRQSLTTLLMQATELIEVIVVDDGSVDATLNIINQSFHDYLNAGILKLISQKNQGVSAARNAGIDKASGRFIGFMDADDLVLPGYVQHLMQATYSGADIVEFGFKTFKESLDEVKQSDTCYSNTKFGLRATGSVITSVSAISRWYPWTRIFKASLFENIRFPNGVRFCEDLMTIPFLYENAQSVLSLELALYGYRANPTSATFNVRPDYVENLEEFYSKIPYDGKHWHDYLRLAVAYAVHSCQVKSGGGTLPVDIKRDMRRLRFKLSIYRDIEMRRIGILLYPRLFELFKKLRFAFHKA